MAATLLFKKLNEAAKAPTRGSDESAGHDLYSIGDWEIPPREVVAISTGIAIQLPDNTVGIICDRSGLATKGITTHVNRCDTESLKAWYANPDGYIEQFAYKEIPLGGILDSDYRGEIKVILYNASDVPYKITKGDRVAQLLIFPCIKANSIECEMFSTKEGVLSSTARDTGGLGSTGK